MIVAQALILVFLVSKDLRLRHIVDMAWASWHSPAGKPLRSLTKSGTLPELGAEHVRQAIFPNTQQDL